MDGTVVTGGEKKKHAILSPSGADRWLTCPGSVSLCLEKPDNDNAYSAEGTDYHEVAAVCLEEGTNATDYVGQPMLSGALVDEENAKHVQKYVDLVRSYVAQGGSLLIEETVPLTHITGEPDAEGTSDAIVLREDPELIIVDLKFGRGVEVSADDNRQGKMYALGVLEKHALWDEYETVRIVISQPRLDVVSEWCCSVEELRAFMLEVRAKARIINERLENPSLPALPLVPSEKACRFCKAKADCPALEKHVMDAMTTGFIDESNPKNPKVTVSETGERLGAMMQKAVLAELWIKAVRAQVEAELLAGRDVAGYKLVQGKKGNRQWADESAVEALLKSFRVKKEVMYDMSLISPTTAEKRFAKDNPKRWEKLEEHITQKEGVPSVAPEWDKRPALVLQKPEEGFEVVEDGSDLI